jgi:hypothetical protein
MVNHCEKCESTSGRVVKILKSAGKVLLWSCVVAVIMIFTTTSFDPFQSYHMRKANMVAVGARGKDIYMAIEGASTERAQIGLPSLWPKNHIAYTNNLDDMSAKIYKTSSAYFYELYDGSNVGNDNHDPYVFGFDYSKLAGAGVPAKCGKGRLLATNNLWVIAANITKDDDNRIPLLITRNVEVKEIERVVNQGLRESEFKKRITFSETYKEPFSNKGFVAVCKGGSTLVMSKKCLTLGELFDNKELPPRDPSKPPIVYLMP